LWALNGSADLAVGEGIESVLAAIKLGIADPPAWAATVANNLSRLPVIPHVNELTILADNDANRTSEQHARELRRKWTAAGSAAVVRMPTKVGTDFNDLLLERHS
jgi:putative DNA primase/helicase